MWKMVFRKKHVKRTLELIGKSSSKCLNFNNRLGAVAIVYLMLEILEANTLKGGEYHPGYRPMPSMAPEFGK